VFNVLRYEFHIAIDVLPQLETIGKLVYECGASDVQHVSNIYKYYVAYKLVVEQGESLQ
jgi:hypothetical protein